MNAVKKRKGGIKKPLGIKAYELLKEKMITLELPPGMKLEEYRLMDLVNMGRTPIREAIKMLITEELLVSHGTNSIYVKHLTLKSAKDLRLLITTMGTLAFDLANPNSDFSGIIEELESIDRMMNESTDKGDTQTFVLLNAEFHKTLNKVADNEFLDHALKRIYFFEARQTSQISLSLGEKRGPKYNEFYTKVHKHHREFINYLSEKDFKKLKEIYKDHMGLAWERLSTYFGGNL